jgi:hypothetical protein
MMKIALQILILNIVMNDKDELMKIQGTAEDAPFQKRNLMICL